MKINDLIYTKHLYYFSIEGSFQRLPFNPSYHSEIHITVQGASVTILPGLRLQLSTQALRKSV